MTTRKEDAIVKRLLQAIGRGDTDSVAVLVDRLEEIDHSLAKRLKASWDRWNRHVRCFRLRIWKPRRHRTIWEECALWHRWLRSRVAKLFDRKWKGMTLHALEKKNCHLSTIIEERTDDDSQG